MLLEASRNRSVEAIAVQPFNFDAPIYGSIKNLPFVSSDSAVGLIILLTMLALTSSCGGAPRSSVVLNEVQSGYKHQPMNRGARVTGDYAEDLFSVGLMHVRNSEHRKAIELWEKAAEHGHIHSMLHLGSIYYLGYPRSGNGPLSRILTAIVSDAVYPRNFQVISSLEKSFYWYEKAAEEGSIDGLHAAGYMLIEGLGVQKDFVRGRNYLEAAFANGNYLAGLKLSEFTEVLSEKEIYLVQAAREEVPSAMYELSSTYFLASIFKKNALQMKRVGLELGNTELTRAGEDVFLKNTGGFDITVDFSGKANYWGEKAYIAGVEDALVFCERCREKLKSRPK